MALIIDAITINKKRFTEWAKQYLDISPDFFVNGMIRREETIISFLLENDVFTLDELKAEFKQYKIYISERTLKKCLNNRGVKK